MYTNLHLYFQLPITVSLNITIAQKVTSLKFLKKKLYFKPVLQGYDEVLNIFNQTWLTFWFWQSYLVLHLNNS